MISVILSRRSRCDVDEPDGVRQPVLRTYGPMVLPPRASCSGSIATEAARRGGGGGHAPGGIGRYARWRMDGWTERTARRPREGPGAGVHRAGRRPTGRARVRCALPQAQCTGSALLVRRWRRGPAQRLVSNTL